MLFRSSRWVMTAGAKSGVVVHGAASVRSSSAGCLAASVVSTSNSAMGMEEVVARKTTSEDEVNHARGGGEKGRYAPSTNLDVIVQGC